MNKQFTKYSFVCDPNECDALLEFTARDGFDFPNGVVQITCPCGRQMQYISCTIEDITKKGNTMDQTVINATEDFLKSQITDRDVRIQNLEEHIQRVTQRDYATRGELQGMRDGMQEWTLNALESREISETNAEEIADICGFELTKEFEVEVTVMYSVTVNARNEEEAQNAIHDIDFDSVSYNDEAISYLSSSIDNVEI
jgi:hypothetical protein